MDHLQDSREFLKRSSKKKDVVLTLLSKVKKHPRYVNHYNKF